MDPPEPQAAHNLKELARLGVAGKIGTGDNRYVAAHVAEAVGVRGEGVGTGAELNAMNDEALWQRANDAFLLIWIDLVLLSHDLDVLRRGIEQGRHTFANTIKYIFATTSANYGTMVSKALASLFLLFLLLFVLLFLFNKFLSDILVVFFVG